MWYFLNNNYKKRNYNLEYESFSKIGRLDQRPLIIELCIKISSK